jgi:hypothetical protein
MSLSSVELGNVGSNARHAPKFCPSLFPKAYAKSEMAKVELREMWLALRGPQ